MKVIIHQPWGGLGDNLQYSTLPELFSRKGFDVYISVNNKVRNQEIFDLVWGQNPYVKGISVDSPNAGECKNWNWPSEEQNEYSMHRIEMSHGFEKTNFFPKIYYVPQNVPTMAYEYGFVLQKITTLMQNCFWTILFFFDFDNKNKS